MNISQKNWIENQLDGIQAKYILGVLGAIIVISFSGFLLMWSFDNNYRSLYSGLSQEEAANIVKGLDEKKIDYKVSAGGEEILVKSENVDQLKLQLISDGVHLNSNVGFEVFDGADFGMTDFAQKINLQRALQGELARTIMALSEVKIARVHLVLPENSLFSQVKSDPKASVTIIPNRGVKLSERKINGIQRLVSSSIEGMSRENVTVLNSEGIVISQSESKEFNAVSNIESKQEVEAYLRQKIETMLARLSIDFQPVVDIDVTLDYMETRKTTEQFNQPTDPERYLVSSKTTKKFTDKESKASVKVLDTVSEQKEYAIQVDKEVQEQITKPGGIKRITVGLLVPDYVSDTDLVALASAIEGVVGLDRTRGDLLLPKKVSNWKHVTATTQASNSQDVHSPLTGSNDISQKLQAETPTDTVMSSDRLVMDDFVAPQSYSILLIVGAFVVLLLVVFTRRMFARKISKQQRLEVLTDMRSWLQADLQPSGFGVANHE